MDLNDQQDEEEQRTVFIAAGLALYLSNSVEQALVNLIVIDGILEGAITAAYGVVEAKFDLLAKKTLGGLIDKLGAKLSPHILAGWLG